MSENRIRYKLNSANAKNNVNTDGFIKVNLEGSERLLPSDDINAIVDSGVVFNNERQGCTKYRLLGTIKPIISNVLFNITGINSWVTFNQSIFTTDQFYNVDVSDIDLTYAESYGKYLKERDGWFGYYNPIITYDATSFDVTTCDFNYMEPAPDKFAFVIPTNTTKNWELTVTYPFSADTKHFLVYDPINNVNALLVTDYIDVFVGGRYLIALSTPVKHGLSQGDMVRISYAQPFNGDYRVIRLGLDNGDDKDFYFCIEVVNASLSPTNPNPNPNPLLNSNSFINARMNRLVASQESEYYLRLFKKITTVNTSINNGVIENDDYEIYQTAFSKTVYRDEVAQFVFNEDIEISGLTDNLGRPLSEIYLTVLKNSGSTFTHIKSGVECALVQNVFQPLIPMIQRINNGNGFLQNDPLPLESSVSIADDEFYGDVVEYNRYEVIEHKLGVVAHRFNTTNRESSGTTLGGIPTVKISGPRYEGYYYYPHTLLKIRDFSTYIEQGDVHTVGIPSYAEDLGDGRWLWRDLLDIGVNDGQYKAVNYPFLNGSHYLYNNFCFPVRRQDPHKQFDLYYTSTTLNDPSDILAIGLTNKFKVNSAQNAC